MQVIPAINCGDFKCVKEKLEKAAEFGGEWVHLDVSDGKFTPVTNWNNPAQIKTDLNIEVHLMVERPEDFVGDWLKAGAKRLIIHLESLNREEGSKTLDLILDKCGGFEAEVMLAARPETPAEDFFPYLDLIYYFQFLAVTPGPSGQEFDEKILEKIQILRERAPEATIEVDGGLNPIIAEELKLLGVNIIASASYIWNSKIPEIAYEELQKI